MTTAAEDYPIMARLRHYASIRFDEECERALDEIDRLRAEVARLRELVPGV